MRYTFKTRPFEHQKEGLRFLLGRETGGALLCEPRTGKTRMAIDYAAALHMAGKVTRVLVVCPVSVIGVWESEIARRCPVRTRVTVWDRQGRKALRLPAWGSDVLDVVLVNYDAFSTPGKKTASGRRSRRGGRFEILKQLKAWQADLLVLDESHRVKSPSAKKTRALVGLAQTIERRVIMTGTVVTKRKRIFDVYAQWKIVNPERFADVTDDEGQANFKAFRERYGVWTERNGFPQWLRNRNVKELRERVHADAFAVTRDECFDLPPRRHQIVPVTLDRSAATYDEMAEYMVAQLEDGSLVEASMKLVQILRLQQITSGTTKNVEGKLIRVGREKIEVFHELASDLFEADEKIVVAGRFRPDLAAVVDSCRTLGARVFELHGGIKRPDRDRAIADFKRCAGPAAFVMQPAAGSLGIDLSAAATMIWFSLTPSYVDFVQACDRVALARRETTFTYLLARDTVDEVLYETLQGDGDVVRAISASPRSLLRTQQQKNQA